MTLYKDGLLKTIQTIINRNLETGSRRKLTFEDLVHFARSEYEAFRARAR